MASHHVSSKHPNSACLSLTVQCSEMWCSLKCNTHVLMKWGVVHHHLRRNFPKCTSWVTRWTNKIKMSCLDFPLSSRFGVSVSKFQNWVVRTVIRWVGGFAPSCRFAEAAGESANVGAAGPPGEVSSEVGEERILQVLMWMVLNLWYCYLARSPHLNLFLNRPVPGSSPNPICRTGWSVFAWERVVKWALTWRLRLPSSFQVHSIYFTSSHPKIKLERIICVLSAQHRDSHPSLNAWL